MTPALGAPTAHDLARRWQDAASGDAVALIGNLLQAYALFTDAGLRDDLASLFTEAATCSATPPPPGRPPSPTSCSPTTTRPAR